MSHINNIKNLLNIKEKNLKILDVTDEYFKGVKNKECVKKCDCPHCKSKKYYNKVFIVFF